VGRLVGLAVLAALLTACAATRVVPVPAAGVRLDPGEQSATVEAEGVQVIARPSAWRGAPSSLPDYVTPFFLGIANGSPLPLHYDYADLRLFDEARFQYTALPPADVVRILRAAGAAATPPPVAVAATGTAAPLHWRRSYLWDPWWWGPPFYPYYPPPRYDDVLVRALPVGTLDAGARTEGFVYFPRLRPDARRLVLEVHYRLGEAPRVLALPFAVERVSGTPVAAG
jgi:hypothetical protein